MDSLLSPLPWGMSTDRTRKAVMRMEQAAIVFVAVRDSVLAGSRPRRAALTAANIALLGVERALTRPEGLRGRPWYRNVMYAPDRDNNYASTALPSVVEAIRAGDRALVVREVEDLAPRFDAATAALGAAAAALRATER